MMKTLGCWFLLVVVVLQSFPPGTEAQTLTKTDCIEGTVFTLVSNDDSAFEDAVDKCAAQDPSNSSVLAAIRNRDHFVAAVALAGNSGSSWIGLVDNEEGKSDTDRFKYISSDQTGILDFVNVGRSNFPWGNNQPNNGDQKCVSLLGFGNGNVLFNDDTCTDQRRYLCSSNCVIPTTSPTPNLTPDVTPNPTPNLTPNPTPNPTPNKTPNPTPNPTSTPPPVPNPIPNPKPDETTESPSTKSEDTTDINIGIIIGTLLPILALASLFVFMVMRRQNLRKQFGKSTYEAKDASTFKKTMLQDIQSKNGAGVVDVAQTDFSLDQFIKPGINATYASGKASAAPLIPVATVAINQRSNPGFVAATKKNSESSSKSLIPRPALSSATLVRKKKEKADEDEFEALLANNGKKTNAASLRSKDEEEFEVLIANKGKKSSLKVSKADEEEFEAIFSASTKKKSRVSGRKGLSNSPGLKKNSLVPPPASTEARPQSTYLKTADENKNRKSIFRPSSAFLSRAKRDKAMKKQKEELKKKAAVSKKKLGIDSDI